MKGAENQINDLLKLCKQKIAYTPLFTSCTTFSEERVQLREIYKTLTEKVSKQSFLAAFFVWIREVASLRPETLNLAKMLLENSFIHISDTNGALWTIAHAREFDHRIVLDAIRCRRDLSLQIREQLVTNYISFMQWLSEETHGYINKLDDTEWERVKGRALIYPLFITFLNALNDKEQLVAKLLYYGGSRTLEEVLSLQLEHVDFEKRMIYYQSQLINYPGHVFVDIQAIVANKSHGPVFIGRRNASLNPATIFRNFKEAAIQVGLGSSFSPAVLTSGS